MVPLRQRTVGGAADEAHKKVPQLGNERMPELEHRGRSLADRLCIAAVVLAIIAISVKVGATEAVRHMAAVYAPQSPMTLADPIGPRWFEDMVRDFTALGSTGVTDTDRHPHGRLPVGQPQALVRCICLQQPSPAAPT